ncbi:MAG: NTP transferase domain-containing protein [Pseudomonadota bacterium]
MPWRALVLAGERPEGDPLAASEGASSKAFVEIAGRPMIAHVLETLARVPAIEHIAVSIGPGAPALPPGPWQRLDAAAGPSESVGAAFAALGAPLLVTTADHPMLRAETVASFLQAAEGHGAAAVAGVARAATAAAAPGAPQRTMMRFRDGAVTGCNLFALTRVEAQAAVATWRRLEALRKRPLSLALAIGPLFAARLLTGRISRAEGEAAIARKAGVAVGTVELDDPLAAHDVDRPDHLAFARRTLGADPP